MSEKIYKNIIVGAGPAGVALAAELIEYGVSSEDILILEKADQKSWVMRELYPDQKLVTANFKGMDPICHGIMRFTDMSKNEALDVLKNTATKYSIQIKYETFVNKVEKIGEEFVIQTTNGDFKSKFCAIGIGIFGKPNKPAYKIASSVKKLTQFDITSTKLTGLNVLVVGGGDSASEYVQFLHRDGNKVTISSREADFSYMNDHNKAIIKQLIADGAVVSLAGSDIVEVGEEAGKAKVFFKDNMFEPHVFDRIVYAIGGTTPLNFLTITGMKIENKKPIIDENLETTVKGLYLLGDLANDMKGGSIVLAFNTAHVVATHILQS